MSNDGVVSHLAELFRIQRARLAEYALVYRDLADIVQVSCGTERPDFALIHSKRLADGGGVTSDTK